MIWLALMRPWSGDGGFGRSAKSRLERLSDGCGEAMAAGQGVDGKIRRGYRAAQAGPADGMWDRVLETGTRQGETGGRRWIHGVWLLQVFNGVSYGALLFLLGSGLSLIFGVMRIVNIAHGSYFLLGSYVALTVIWTTGAWLLALPAGALAIGLLGLGMERIFLRPFGFDVLRQVLVTFGFMLLFQQAALDIGAAIISSSTRRRSSRAASSPEACICRSTASS
jgi:hypothetical protein